MHLGLVAVPLAAVVSWFGGAAWYGLLGKQWTSALGWDAEEVAKLKQQSPLLPMLFGFLAELVMALVLLIVIGPITSPRLLHGLLDGVVLWLGFVVTTTAVNYAYQRKTLALLAIDAGHWLMVLMIQGAIVSMLR